MYSTATNNFIFVYIVSLEKILNLLKTVAESFFSPILNLNRVLTQILFTFYSIKVMMRNLSPRGDQSIASWSNVISQCSLDRVFVFLYEVMRNCVMSVERNKTL